MKGSPETLFHFTMNVQDQILKHINSQLQPKSAEMMELHRMMLRVMPEGKLWFDEGKNSENKIVSNPTIGYG